MRALLLVSLSLSSASADNSVAGSSALGLRTQWPSEIACKKPFHLQISSQSFGWRWRDGDGVERLRFEANRRTQIDLGAADPVEWFQRVEFDDGAFAVREANIGVVCYEEDSDFVLTWACDASGCTTSASYGLHGHKKVRGAFRDRWLVGHGIDVPLDAAASGQGPSTKVANDLARALIAEARRYLAVTCAGRWCSSSVEDAMARLRKATTATVRVESSKALPTGPRDTDIRIQLRAGDEPLEVWCTSSYSRLGGYTYRGCDLILVGVADKPCYGAEQLNDAAWFSFGCTGSVYDKIATSRIELTTDSVQVSGEALRLR
jgi:hypothetical protein